MGSTANAAQGNNRAVMENFYSDHSSRVYSVALKLTGDATDAKTITQEVFVEAFQALGNDKQAELLAKDLKRIALEKCIEYLRYAENAKLTKSELTEETERFFVSDVPADGVNAPADVLADVFDALEPHSQADSPPVFKEQTIRALPTATAPTATIATTVPTAATPEKPEKANRNKMILLVSLIAGVFLLVVLVVVAISSKVAGNNADDDSAGSSGVAESEGDDFAIDGFTRLEDYEGGEVTIDTDRTPHIHMGGKDITNELLAQYLEDGTIPPDTIDLSLEDNQISDLAPLAALPDMDWLSIANNQISDLSALSEFSKLRVLWAQDNNISDITPLLALTSLDELRLTGNPLSEEQIAQLRQALPDCRIQFGEP